MQTHHLDLFFGFNGRINRKPWRRGTKAPNRYGPDPLPASEPAI
jgi:uncharacterized membrane protein YhaH (DUF805 family)